MSNVQGENSKQRLVALEKNMSCMKIKTVYELRARQSIVRSLQNKSTVGTFAEAVLQFLDNKEGQQLVEHVHGEKATKQEI